ncbi:putative Translocation protein [Taphrina deformans PYCC 5710]|uniref:Translocation protein n=1 Tax=Taphrina deformans (strain PYCC 5710 / ATCC 11124 / CBS 356.35 / IMI 108563 / JCM 9778 / NBRC 8474) TaxID=1097556 RepID=R4X8K1_TAPDE|nr:putative Translocation protein [Taphrina deformans PYCC 5710]|eukprot:CCG81670.1 putative Translocation protein [Taphrina deformans PYCC 5710]
MVSVFVPILYLAVLIGGLGTFSYFYRRRKPAPVSQLEEWFPPNKARDVYFSLQAQDNVPTGILKSALLLRAVEDIKRLQQVQTQKTALNVLMQKGGAGDDLWTRFLQLEEEMKAEVMDVVNEAQALQEGWNQLIFQTANEMMLNDTSRQTLSKIVGMAAEVKQEFIDSKEQLAETQTRMQKNRETRVAREKEETAARVQREEREAEEQREKVRQELIAMEEKESKSASGTNSPRNRRKK